MASLELPNTDFFNLNQSVTQLLRALDDAKTQRTVRRGARQSVQAPTQQSEAEVQGDLRTVLQNPLAKREPRGYGALKLDAVRSIRPLHESLVRLARGNVVATDAVDNDDTNAELHVRLRDFVESVDPVHPFLQVPLETNDTSGGGDVEGERGEAGGEQVQKEGEDAATETQNTVKKQQQQKGKQTLSKKARGKQRADPNVSHGAAIQAVPELRRSARLRAHTTQGYATAREADDLVEEPVSDFEDALKDLSDGEDWDS